jgi:hypothetical protein
MIKPVMILIIPSAAMILCTAEVSGTLAEFRRRGPPVGRRCGTCGAVFATQDALWAHLLDKYHGFQCLRCGALYACPGDHTCPCRSQGPEACNIAARDGP